MIKNNKKLDYCEAVLKQNKINVNEVLYYSGRTGKNPHNIENKYWRQASNAVGLNVRGYKKKVFPR